ncbi:MAG: serine/threonine-protein kinase [Planctomycetota bacterium]|nr:serine/threonine-protein kinase [Planctomycetota bacterium]
MEALGTQFFDSLASCLDAFIAAWEAEETPPHIAAHLPRDEPKLIQYALLELVKVDLEYRWARGLGKTVDAYLEDFPLLDDGDGPPSDLIYEEFHHRKKAGDACDPEEYYERYPSRTDELERLFELHTPDMSTSLAGQMPREVPDPGESIDDFLLIDRLGRGAFATVFLARQRSMQRTVALKVSANRGEEAQTLAQLDHPNIVRVFDQRILPEQDLRLLYMEYVPAGGLDQVVDRVLETPPEARRGQLLLDFVDQALLARGESPPTDSMMHERLATATWAETVCVLGAQLARALAYAHERGVLHRDVKPANVLLARTGAAKLADFNISYSNQLEGSSAAAYLGGSMAYMSAEQLEACSPVHSLGPDDLDGQIDIFSLGVLLFELLTGYRPFIEDDTLRGGWSAAIQEMIDTRRAPIAEERLALVPKDAPGLLLPTLLRCMDPDPAKRFHDAGEVARHLELALMPRAAELIAPPPDAKSRFARRHTILSLTIAGLIPNVVLSVFNILFNLLKTVPEDQQTAFMDMLTIVNVIAYAAGVGVALAWMRPLARAAKAVELGARPDGVERARIRRGLLRFPERIMWVVFALWALASVAFPVWLSVRGRADFDVWFQFTASNTLFGVIAAAAVYFVAMRVVLWALLPPFIDVGAGTVEDRERLREVSPRSAVWFGAMTAVPFISLILLAIQRKTEPTPLIVLGLLGSVAFALAYVGMLAIRRDVGALDRAMTPKR